MPKKTGRIGGFAAQNSGRIENCYSVVQVKSKGYTAGGFVGENTGTIEKSCSYYRKKGLTGGFTGIENGNSETACYFFHHEKEGSKKLEKLSDTIRGQRLKEIEDEEDIRKLGFDTDKIWLYCQDGFPLQFIPETWLFHLEESSKYPQYLTEERGEAKAVVITNAKELWQLAEKINGGDRELGGAYIRLDDDIDLGGKEWIPIGKDRSNAFTGIFDGCGHTVRNFVVKDKKTENKGFFGFIKEGEVYNLSVDCILKKGTCSGGIAAQNEGGVIGCCSAVIEIKGKNGAYGGLVGRNTGIIFESYTAGRIIAAAIIWWWFPLLLLPLLGLLLLLPQVPGMVPTFAPVPYDEDQIPIPNEEISPNAEGNFVSFQFEQKIDVSRSTGACKFGFKNPGNSNHNIVVQLQFTDAQAIRVMGSTGRTAKEQEKLEDSPGYDPETYRTVIAESGAIRPGYQLEDLKLVQQPNGAAVPVGDYNAMVYLVFYDIETNNRAMLESQLPVVITVHD